MFIKTMVKIVHESMRLQSTTIMIKRKCHETMARKEGCKGPYFK